MIYFFKDNEPAHHEAKQKELVKKKALSKEGNAIEDLIDAKPRWSLILTRKAQCCRHHDLVEMKENLMKECEDSDPVLYLYVLYCIPFGVEYRTDRTIL
jgi:hypothetical protein